MSIGKQKSFLRRWAKIGLLLGIKESYLLLRNVWGLKEHPFKTLREIERSKDRSQQLLLLGLPILSLLLGGLLLVMARKLITAPQQWGSLAKILLGSLIILAGGIGAYLGYWWLKVKKINKQGWK